MTTGFNRSFRITLTAALMTSMLLSLPAFSQDRDRLDRLAEHLSLSAEQQSSVADLIAAHRDRMASIRDRISSNDPQTLRQHARAERLALMEEIKAQLDPEQREAFRETRRRLRDRRGGSETRFRQAMGRLDLSPDQVIDIETLIEYQKAEQAVQRQRFFAEVEFILNADQSAQWQEMRRRKDAGGH